ncbi:hypothetical protein [Streptosporangium pseudovulgare]|uniref:Uncharacterized protein n=1 Tax=Streptosporangium pseudovulgare TaxID=35765 RepID=A0ABQ2QSX9_9ACTN|nr:hypothetical protein [Streptosporangium pseudovulgare]GGP91976.1 hypothetical protein GCM10010140_22190 [Streptosporangium pseudovulgare]
MVLVLGQGDEDERNSSTSRRLAWIGVVARYNTAGAVNKSITVDPLRECMETIMLDGHDGLLSRLSKPMREEFEQAAILGGVSECSYVLWEAVNTVLRAAHPELIGLLNWLIAQADPSVLDNNDPADHAWQEQQDTMRSLLWIAEFPHSSLAAWQRPSSRDAPYLAGLIPHPRVYNPDSLS